MLSADARSSIDRIWNVFWLFAGKEDVNGG